MIDNDYENKIKYLSKKYRTHINLRKKDSERMLKQICPWCAYWRQCVDMASSNREYHLCIARSTETLSTWILHENKIDDLVGEVFGYLKILSSSEPNKHGQKTWLCKCECENITEVRDNDLKTGNTISCGCKKGKHDVAPHKLGKRRYKRGSSKNPDGMRHVSRTGYSSHVGRKSEHLENREDENGNKYQVYANDICDECGNLLRENVNSQKQCVECGLIH
jgi:hypothetical protein